MASVLTIYNRALQKLGAKQLGNTDESSVSGRACRTCYDELRLVMLRRHSWNCAIKRANLAAALPLPITGQRQKFALPADYVRLLRPDPEENSQSIDYVIENGFIFSNLSAPLPIRYVFNLVDANQMDPLFREALSSKMAVEMCEQITQSSTKKSDMVNLFREAMAEAKSANAFEIVARISPDDDWVTVRSSGGFFDPTRKYST